MLLGMPYFFESERLGRSNGEDLGIMF